MTCDAMRDRLFEAELAELRQEANTPLAQHLSTCADCRALAQKIVGAEAALDAALDSVSDETRTRPGRARRKLGHWATLVPLAAAAALVAILLRGGNEAPLTPVTAMTPVASETPIVETTSDQNVAVFTTADPDIVVVWFLGGTD